MEALPSWLWETHCHLHQNILHLGPVLPHERVGPRFLGSRIHVLNTALLPGAHAPDGPPYRALMQQLVPLFALLLSGWTLPPKAL